MDASGACRRECANATKSIKESGHLAECPVDTDRVLCAHAMPVRSVDDLSSPHVVRVPFPEPFGRFLLLEPVLWSLRNSQGQAVELTVAELHRLLARLQARKGKDPVQQCVVPLASVDDEVDAGEFHDIDLSDDSEGEEDDEDEGEEVEDDLEDEEEEEEDEEPTTLN